MKSKTYSVALLLVALISWNPTNAQDSLWVRKYQFGIYNQYDLRNSSLNGITTHRILHDAFRKGIKPKMNEKLGNVSYGVFSFAATYLTLIWSHEFGHSLRAKQVGGNFNIHNVALPIPYTTMHLPENINLVDEALSVTAGFEVNYISVRSLQREFILQNGSFNEDLAFSFANRLMYPLYVSVIIPADPEDKDVWINTAGDPIHVALPVFKNYSGNQVFMADSTVNPKLVTLYKQSALLSILFNLADPQLYREVGASFGDVNKTRRPIFIIGDFNHGWTYGTLFNVSPLGYELYLNNYVHLQGNQLSVYVKYGKPFKNNGLGLIWNDLIQTNNISVSTGVELWDQDLFGKGFLGEVNLKIKLSERVGLLLYAGYKTNGYVLGKQIEKGFNYGASICYKAKY
ncbi:MAG: hypothetical protein OEW67_06145 [Cyclobacteriaceae bacterium]|nr:hypothetical protein [Cyclobacteriaceae bacterium]